MTVQDLLGDLMDAFPRQKITDGTIGVYERELDDLPFEPLAAAVRSLIRTGEWFPTVRAIREATAEGMIDLPTEGDALAQIEARMRWARDREDGTLVMPPPMHQEVHHIVHTLGGFFSFRATEEPGIVRSQFLRLYRERRAQAVREIQVGHLDAASSHIAVLGTAYPAISR